MRWHLNQIAVSRAFHAAVQRCGIGKRATTRSSRQIVCHAFAGRRLRHSHRAGIAGACEHRDDDDLHARTEHRPLSGPQSTESTPAASRDRLREMVIYPGSESRRTAGATGTIEMDCAAGWPTVPAVIDCQSCNGCRIRLVKKSKVRPSCCACGWSDCGG